MFLPLTRDACHSAETVLHNRAIAIEQIGQDLRHGARMLATNPGFTAVAVLTLALGIGATSAIFSVVDAVLLRPLPYRDSQHLVSIFEDLGSTGFAHKPVSAGTYADIKAQQQLFEDVAAASDHGDILCMRETFTLFLHAMVIVIRLGRPGGLRSVVALI